MEKMSLLAPVIGVIMLLLAAMFFFYVFGFDDIYVQLTAPS